MKKVKLEIHHNKLLPEFDKYYIMFSRYSRLYFSSKRKANDFIAKFSSDTDEIIRVCLGLQSKCYSLYLEYYLEMQPFHCNNIENQLKTIPKGLSFCFKEFSSGNQSFAVSSVWSYLNNIEQLILVLQTWSRTYNKYNLTNECNSMLMVHKTVNNSFFDLTDKGSFVSKVYSSKLKVVHKIAYQMTS